LILLVRLAGFEPTTPWFVAKYSIQLSYSREACDYSKGRPAAAEADNMAMQILPGEPLRHWTAAILERCGVAAHDAAVTARILVRTSLRGIDTHGIARIPSYVANLRSGEFSAAARPQISDRHGTLHCDCQDGLGQVVGMAALEAAVARAGQQAIVACTIRNCGHLAALGVLVLEAAERGMVAVLCQGTPPILGLPGFQGRAIGNNPLAFAMPVAGEAPLVFDMAMSEVARGRVLEALREGRATIPEGWAIDSQGRPTTDTKEAAQGAMVPAAGHKGMGLAMLVECLAVSLSGASATAGMSASGGSSGSAGAFLLVANPKLLVGQAAFDDSVAHWLGRYRQAAGGDGRYPGQRQAQSEAERVQAGIPVGDGLRAELAALGNELGLAFPG
jgi:LDH2 family malate/lactate/ureidoglycolate dehydrogenase